MILLAGCNEMDGLLGKVNQILDEQLTESDSIFVSDSATIKGDVLYVITDSRLTCAGVFEEV